MCNYIIGVDDELWAIIEDGITFTVDRYRIITDRKSLTTTQKKEYKKHHRVRGILVDSLPHSE